MLSCMDEVLQKRYQKLSPIKIVKALEVLFDKESAEVHEMTEVMDECNIDEEQGDRFADYYDSISAMGVEIRKTHENDLLFSLLY